jgi:hypothetical protein
MRTRRRSRRRRRWRRRGGGLRSRSIGGRGRETLDPDPSPPISSEPRRRPHLLWGARRVWWHEGRRGGRSGAREEGGKGAPAARRTLLSSLAHRHGDPPSRRWRGEEGVQTSAGERRARRSAQRERVSGSTRRGEKRAVGE